MPSPANRCPSCGAERVTDSSGGICPQCKVTQPSAGGRTNLNTTANSGRGHSDATQAYIPGADESTGSFGRAAEVSSSGEAAGRKKTLTPGTNIRYFGDYLLEKELGRGGMGVGLQGPTSQSQPAGRLKMVKAGLLADEGELRRFQNEAEAVALLDHPGIVPVYEVGEHEGQRYFSMKLIVGSNLAEKLASYRDDHRAIGAVMIETADAVQHAHMRGILHRDLKPANILIDTQGHPHITDFGLAKLMESDDELTASGAILGTPAYMSPEQAAGPTRSDHSGDGCLWSGRDPLCPGGRQGAVWRLRA